MPPIVVGRMGHEARRWSLSVRAGPAPLVPPWGAPQARLPRLGPVAKPQVSTDGHPSSVSTSERLLDRARRARLRIRQVAGTELRSTRVGLGRSQDFVGHACDIDHSQVSRIERGVLATVTVDQLSRMASVLGLDVSIKFYPGGQPLRDQAQVNLIDRFRKQVGPPLRCRAEVPVPIPGDQRAWDLQVLGASKVVGVEAESRMRDSQATLRKIMLKARDSGDRPSDPPAGRDPCEPSRDCRCWGVLPRDVPGVVKRRASGATGGSRPRRMGDRHALRPVDARPAQTRSRHTRAR